MNQWDTFIWFFEIGWTPPTINIWESLPAPLCELTFNEWGDDYKITIEVQFMRYHC
jgi:hypothetical protein